MIKIENFVGPSNGQWQAAVRGMRNPMNSWGKSDSVVCPGEPDRADGGLCPFWESGSRECAYSELWGCGNGRPRFLLMENDMALAKRLCAAGPEHRKFLRQLPVIMDITAPLYWWKQMDAYKVGAVADSCSTMHKLTEKPFSREDFSFDCLDRFAGSGGRWAFEDTVIGALNVLRDLSLDDPDSDTREYAWRALVELLPEGYNQKRTWSANYETLRNICRQRGGHKLPEWAGFIGWIRRHVPFARDLIGV